MPTLVSTASSATLAPPATTRSRSPSSLSCGCEVRGSNAAVGGEVELLRIGVGCEGAVGSLLEHVQVVAVGVLVEAGGGEALTLPSPVTSPISTLVHRL